MLNIDKFLREVDDGRGGEEIDYPLIQKILERAEKFSESVAPDIELNYNESSKEFKKSECIKCYHKKLSVEKFIICNIESTEQKFRGEAYQAVIIKCKSITPKGEEALKKLQNGNTNIGLE